MRLFHSKSINLLLEKLAKLSRKGLLKDKLDLIDFAFSRFDLHTFADLGAVWGVNGGYTFYTLEKHDISAATLVDTHLTNVVQRRARKFAQLRVLIGEFGNEMIAGKIGKVDAIFLFDVLLHQVAPDWHRILEIYALQTKSFIIYNQQWIGSEQTVRLLELGEEEYFRNVPHKSTQKPYDDLFMKLEKKHPDHDKPWRDVHHIWQWGITDIDLRSKIESLGFKLEFIKNCGQFGNLPNFENHAFIFIK